MLAELQLDAFAFDANATSVASSTSPPTHFLLPPTTYDRHTTLLAAHTSRLRLQVRCQQGGGRRVHVRPQVPTRGRPLGSQRQDGSGQDHAWPGILFLLPSLLPFLLPFLLPYLLTFPTNLSNYLSYYLSYYLSEFLSY